jgi:hypothetical protein
MPRNRSSEHRENKLAKLLRDACIRAEVEHNSTHDNPDFVAVKLIGRVFPLVVARELLRLGLLMEDEVLVEKPKRIQSPRAKKIQSGQGSLFDSTPTPLPD